MVTDVGGIPVVQTGGYDNGMGGNWIWAFLLFALIGGNGFGGFGGRGVAQVDNTVWDAQQFSQIDNGIRALGSGLCSTTYDLNNSIKDGNYSTGMAIQESKYQLGNGICASTYEISSALRDGFCGVNRNIDGVNFNIATQTNALTNVFNAGFQSIKDMITCNKMEELQKQIFEASQEAQTLRIIASQKPLAPVPAYVVQSPYAPYYNNCC